MCLQKSKLTTQRNNQGFESSPHQFSQFTVKTEGLADAPWKKTHSLGRRMDLFSCTVDLRVAGAS